MKHLTSRNLEFIDLPDSSVKKDLQRDSTETLLDRLRSWRHQDALRRAGCSISRGRSKS